MLLSNGKRNDQGLVSVLMNCYNGEVYLHDAIESVINQTYQNWELIFWDNRSNDNSKVIFDSYDDSRMKYYQSKHHTNLGGARANAFKHLSGKFIAILDTDDMWLPEKLEKQIKLFDDPEVGIVISDTIFFNEHNERQLYNGKYPSEGNIFRNLLTDYFVSLETLMLRKSVVDTLDYGFDEDFCLIADFDLVLRTAQVSKLAICKEVLAKWRVHKESDSWKSSVSFSDERELWIEKQIKQDSDFSNRYKNEISILHSKNFLLMAINSLSNNKRVSALRFIFKTNFKDWYDYLVICLCFIPFSNLLIQYLQKRRIKNLLK